MPRTKREELPSRISEQEGRLASLDHERSKVEYRLTELKRQHDALGDLPPQIAVTSPAQVPRSNEAKIAVCPQNPSTHFRSGRRSGLGTDYAASCQAYR